jgi:hypothetical protein
MCVCALFCYSKQKKTNAIATICQFDVPLFQ